jgi:cell division septation protein DedD
LKQAAEKEESGTVQPEAAPPAPKIQEPSNIDTPSVRQGGNYRIQVYSLKTQADADEHVKKLIAGGFDAFWKKAVSAGQDWYIVYVGPFKDLNSAKVNLKALKFSGRKPILLSVSTTG